MVLLSLSKRRRRSGCSAAWRANGAQIGGHAATPAHDHGVSSSWCSVSSRSAIDRATLWLSEDIFRPSRAWVTRSPGNQRFEAGEGSLPRNLSSRRPHGDGERTCVKSRPPPPAGGLSSSATRIHCCPNALILANQSVKRRMDATEEPPLGASYSMRPAKR